MTGQVAVAGPPASPPAPDGLPGCCNLDPQGLIDGANARPRSIGAEVTMTDQDPSPIPQRDPTPAPEDAPDDTPDDLRQEAPGEPNPATEPGEESPPMRAS